MIKPLDRTGTWQTYSVANGLPGMRIQHIAEDNEGYIWFATSDSGASRFDGDEFQTFTQQDGLCSNRFFLFIGTIREGCGLLQLMASVGTMEHLSIIWKTTAS